MADDRSGFSPSSAPAEAGPEKSRPAKQRAGTPRKNGLPAHVSLELTIRELELLSSLASDQLFRREFIDPRMPGHRPNPAELELAKAVVGRLRTIAAEFPRVTVSKSNPPIARRSATQAR